MKKWLVSLSTAAVLIGSSLNGGSASASTWEDNATNYSKSEMKEMLREVANEYNIPPEILKAVAYQESKGITQFNPDGTPYISTEDGGIGVMQITLSPEEMEERNIDEEQLKWDTRFNMEVGAQILSEKWNYDLPKVNDHNKKYLEDWYFAVMAYNGLSKRNDPTLDLPKLPYQESVYNYVRGLTLQQVGDTPELEIQYPDEDAPDIMSFPENVDYQWPTSIRTSQDLVNGDVVYTYNPFYEESNIRDSVNGSVSREVKHYTPLRITDGPFETNNDRNLYVMYKVEGNGFDGYISSSNIIYSETLKLFPDIERGEVARAVSYLQLRDIVDGHDDGTFKPDNVLLRRHAAKLIVEALDLKLPEGYQMKATDMKPGDLGYEEMAIAEAHGLMGVGSDLNPAGYLKRAQMAAILVRAFGDYYAEPTKDYTFEDQDGFWNYDQINTLANNNITVADPFKWNSPTTRSQFALFMERTIKLMEAE
jgi:Transglycosylase SLT domain